MPIEKTNCTVYVPDILNQKPSISSNSLTEMLKDITIPVDITVECIVYSFSSGKEVYSYSAKNTKSIENSIEKGNIKILLKVKEKGILKTTLLIEADGYSKEEITKNIILKIRKALIKV